VNLYIYATETATQKDQTQTIPSTTVRIETPSTGKLEQSFGQCTKLHQGEIGFWQYTLWNTWQHHQSPKKASRNAPNSTKARLASAMICGFWDVGTTVGVDVDVDVVVDVVDVDVDETTEDAEGVVEVPVVVGVGV